MFINFSFQNKLLSDCNATICVCALRQPSACAVPTDWKNSVKVISYLLDFHRQRDKVLGPLMPPEV